MATYAMLFKFKDWIQGPGFIAGVRVEGRVLMTKEEDGQWWVYGVTPGGLSESDADPQKAYAKFREFLKGILYDLAEEAGNFEAFKTKVAKFVVETDEHDAAIWDKAREDMRSGKVQPDGPFLGQLIKVTAPSPARLVECIRLDPAPAKTPVVEPMALAGPGEDFLAQAA